MSDWPPDIGIKPYYADDATVIYHGDCRDILPLLPKVDLVLTDPPYGVRHSSNHGASWEGTQIAGDEDASLRDEVLGFLEGIPSVVFGNWKVLPPKDARAELVWDKGPAFGMGDLSFPWKQSWEAIWIIGNGWVGYRDEGVLRGHLVVSWESKGRCHPHEKPVSLCAHFMRKAHRADLILDPFMGSGTTLRAAKDLGRKSIGIEISAEYCRIARDRLAQEVLSFPTTTIDSGSLALKFLEE